MYIYDDSLAVLHELVVPATKDCRLEHSLWSYRLRQSQGGWLDSSTSLSMVYSLLLQQTVGQVDKDSSELISVGDEGVCGLWVRYCCLQLCITCVYF